MRSIVILIIDLVAGTVIGKIGNYTESLATATVVVAKDAELYGMSKDELKRMDSEDPPLAGAIHRLIATSLGRKLPSPVMHCWPCKSNVA